MTSPLPVLLLVMATTPAVAQKTPDDHSAHHPPAAQTAALTDGEIRRIDRDTKKITIRHGPIANLDMPPMSMVFQVHDPALLDRVKPGDKVKFSAIQERGAYVVTHIEIRP